MNWESDLKQILLQTNLALRTQEGYIVSFRKWIRYFNLNNIEVPTEEMYKEFANHIYKTQSYTYHNFKQILYGIVAVFKHYSIVKEESQYIIPKISYLIEILAEGYKKSDKVNKEDITPHAAMPLKNQDIDKIIAFLIKRINQDDSIKDMRMYIALYIAKITGLRRSDIFSLKYENITINRKNKNIYLNLIIKKTKKDFTVPIKDIKFFHIFDIYTKKIAFLQNNYLLGYIKNNRTRQYKQWNRASFYNDFYKLLATVKISKIGCTLVSFRKSLAQNLYDNNGKIESLMHNFRWSSIACISYIKHKY